MFFNRRKKYNGHVATLLPAFGVEGKDAGVFSLLNTLDIAWEQSYTEYEAALLVAYTVYGGMLKASEPRAANVMANIIRIQADWADKGVVSQELISRFSAKVSEWEDINQTPEKAEIELSPSMPDMTETNPFAMFIAGQFFFIFSKDVRSIGERILKSKSPLHFPFAMAAVNQSTQKPEFFVTLEAGITEDIFLCTFDMMGTHKNLGSGGAYKNESVFIKKAIDVACDALNIDKNAISKLST